MYDTVGKQFLLAIFFFIFLKMFSKSVLCRLNDAGVFSPIECDLYMSMLLDVFYFILDEST